MIKSKIVDSVSRLSFWVSDRSKLIVAGLYQIELHELALINLPCLFIFGKDKLFKNGGHPWCDSSQCLWLD